MSNQEQRTQNLEPSFDEPLVKVEGVSKKFCLSLKKSLWYGLCDMGRELTGRRHGSVRPIADTPHPELDSANQEQSTRNPELSGLRPKEFWAVHDVGFELKRGESLGLIGHNGAGKTTLLKMLNGLIKPDAGRIEMRGRVGALIALGAGFNPILTGRENIYVNASVLGLTKRETDAKIDEIIDFAEIGDFMETPVQNYSSGMAVRLGFAVAASLNPDVLLLDEVLAVGDMGFQAKCFNRLGEMRRKGIAFILVSHNMHHITRYCEKVLYLKHGAIAHVGETAAGIEAFEADMQPKTPARPGGNPGAEVFGSGRIKITAGYFMDSEGAKIDCVHADQPFSLVVEFQCAEPPVSDCVMDVVVEGAEGLVYQGRNDLYGCPFAVDSRSGTMKLDFESLPVRARKLFFHFCVMDRTTAEVFDWRRNVELQMHGDPRCTGLIAPHVIWSCKSM